MKRFTVLLICIIFGTISALNAATPIPDSEITYTYPLDFLAPGPQQGDSGQPRSDQNPGYGDLGGNQLTDGYVASTWFETGHVGFTDFGGSGAGQDSGNPQPQIDFDLGGQRALTEVTIHYMDGGLAGILAPDEVDIFFGTADNLGAVNYSTTPDITFACFGKTNSNVYLFKSVTIPVTAAEVTHVRMEFFGGNYNSNTDSWIFLSEVSFSEVVFLDADNDLVEDSMDNCPLTANSNQTDTDGDGEGDACDADDDNDTVLDTADNCPLHENLGQEDFDQDGLGNACDHDDDGDMVDDGDDQCLMTAPAEIVTGQGCSINDLCPCDNNWKNHGKYVSCVSKTAKNFENAGLILKTEHGTIVSEAGMSQCGKKK